MWFFFVSTALTYVALNVLQFHRFVLTTASLSIEFNCPGLINADMGLTCYHARAFGSLISHFTILLFHEYFF